MKKLFFLVVFIPALSLASLRRGANSLDKIKDALGEQARAADSIAASIKSLEKEIGKVNNQYLERSRLNQSLEEKLTKLQEGLSERVAELDKRQSEAQRLTRLYALEGNDEEDENALLKREILTRLLSERLVELKNLKTSAQELRKTLAEYQERLTETRNSEEGLYALIVDLENKKKELSKNYISSLESKNELEEKLENALAKKKAYKVVAKAKNPGMSIQLIPPLDKFASYKGGDKGVTFKYESRAPIKASAGGNVVYSGELASYGKVIMIDHGSEIRSVILGDVEIKVHKGDRVTQGQVVGYTLSEPGLKKSLYYEVRKKNIAQNTLQWLENNSKLATL